LDNADKSYAVSLVIPAYNVEAYIGRAIDSVLAQSRRPEEIIVVDDGSTDGTAGVVQGYGSDVRYIYQEKAGASVARNRGIEEASNEWIAFLDADDEWLPEKLKVQMALMERNPDLVWSYTNYIVRSTKNSTEKIAHDIAEVEDLIQGQDFFNDCLCAYAHGVPTHTITLMVKRKALQEAGMFLKGQQWAQDTDLTFRLAYRWPRVGYISRPLSVHYFQRPGGITEINWNQMRQRCDFLQRHLELSAEYGRLEEFRTCAEMLLRRWVRGILNAGQFAEADEISSAVGSLLPKSMRREMRLCRAFPRLMPLLFKLYFGLKRLLRGGVK
jgi:cellulose synthase/poly-beta-1,6-N-acetylglucosamine synthase-like glycosyltransferase